MKCCVNCGTPLKGGEAFCPKCGKAVVVNSGKNKKNKKAAIASVCVAAAAAAAVLIYFMFVSENGGGSSERLRLSVNENTFEGLDIRVPSGEMAEAFRSRIEYEVTDIEWTGDTGVAYVTVYTPDLSKIVSDGIDYAKNSGDTKTYDDLIEDAEWYIGDTLLSDECPVQEHEINMEAKGSEESWTLVSSDEFERIISGNIGEIFFNAVTEGIENA